MTAREEFRDLLRVHVTPAMRERGFSGAAGKYYLTGPSGHVGSLLISGNPKRSTADAFEYDLHAGVTSTYLRLASDLRGAPVRSRPSVWSDHDWFTTAGGGRFHRGDDRAQHATTLLADVDLRGLRWIRASLTDDGLRAAVDVCHVGVGKGWARVFLDLAQGRLDDARPRVEEAETDLGADDAMVAEMRRRMADADYPASANERG